VKLLSNLPIENLTPENDYLGVIEKGDMIVSLLKSGNIEFEQMKMFALYGNWGSGKSTLMKYMESKLQDDFQTFYFDAWQYENGKDLSFSLLEFMTEKGHDSIQKVSTDLLSYGKKVLIGALKGSHPIASGVISEIKSSKEESFHYKIQQFKRKFREFEEAIFQQENGEKKTNIVFIDDLDRCEPEKVLDLLSEIKLFFTYGERTIFFFGVDEKAVQVAIKTKYRDVVKSNEYLEKVFDLDFQMPSKIILYKLTNQAFSNKLIRQFNGKHTVNLLVAKLFNYLGINNPRKIKKILNKYQILMEASENTKLVHDKGLVMILKHEESMLFIIYSVYLIILKMFSIEEFENFGHTDEKIQKLYSISGETTNKEPNLNIIGHMDLDEFSEQINMNISLSQCYSNAIKNVNQSGLSELLYLTMPINLERFNINFLRSKDSFNLIKISKNNYSMKFTLFVLENFISNYTLSDDDKLTLSISDFKLLIRQII
jgi:energy-coupling factor transporter ATP-binding protein EcfA2